MATTSRWLQRRRHHHWQHQHVCLLLHLRRLSANSWCQQPVNANVELNLRNFNDSYLQQHGHQEFLQYIGRHFYIPATLTEASKLNVVWQTIIQQEVFDANVHYSNLSGILTSDIAIEDSCMEARPATSLRSPSTPSP